MLLRRSFVVAALASSLAGSPLLAQESSTVRIEPRPYYGAVVTLEQGVRVWRPLPPTRHMIINPDHRTPLNLSLVDVRETVTSNNYVQGAVEGSAAASASAGAFAAPGIHHGRNFHHHRHRHGRGLGPGKH